MSEPTTHKELMLAMGQKTGSFDPTAPEWYMRLMVSRDPVERVMGWLQYRTIRYPIHKPYACDELGRVLTLKDLAAFYHWSTRQTQKVWNRAALKGWVNKEEGKLWLRADFKVKYPILGEDHPAADVVSINPIDTYLGSLAPYLREQVAQLPAARRAELAKRWLAWDAARKDVEADAMQAAREKMKPYEAALYGEYKVTVKTLPERQEKRAKLANVQVQVDLFDFAPLSKKRISTTSTAPSGKERATSGPAPNRRAVETPSAVLNSNGRGPEPLPAAHPNHRTAEPPSLVSQPREAAVNGNSGVPAPAPAPKTAAELAPLHAAMREMFLATPRDASKLFGACRDEVSDCTPEEAAGWVRRVIQKARKGIENWAAYFLTATTEDPGKRQPANHVSFKEWCGGERSFEQRKPVQAEESFVERQYREEIEKRKVARG
jgi:hypothetical protein